MLNIIRKQIIFYFVKIVAVVLFICFYNYFTVFADDGKEIEISTDKIKQGTEKVLKKTEKGLNKAAKKTRKALKKAEKKIKEHVSIEKDDPPK